MVGFWERSDFLSIFSAYFSPLPPVPLIQHSKTWPNEPLPIIRPLSYLSLKVSFLFMNSEALPLLVRSLPGDFSENASCGFLF